MKKVFIYALSIAAIAFASCKQQDMSEEVIGGGHLTNFIVLTPEEYASVAYSNDNELSMDEVLAITKSFVEDTEAPVGEKTRNNENASYSIAKKIEIASPQTRSGIKSSLNAYYVNVVSGDSRGIALVSGDRRFPEVLSFCPKAKVEDFTNHEGAFIMSEISKQTMRDQVSYYEYLRDSLEEKTLEKISQKYGINDVNFSEIENKIAIYVDNASNTRGTVDPIGTLVSKIGPFTNTAWDQGDPYNNLLPETDIEEFQGYPNYGRFPTGCVVVVGAQILAYYQPTVVAYGVNMNWSLLLQSPYIFTGEYTKINQVANLMKYIGEETGTFYNEDGGNTSVESLTSFLNRYGITMDGAVNGLNVSRIKVSLDAVRMVVASGRLSSATKGGHSWLFDGYQIRRKNTREILKSNHIYVHANMGWGGTATGYYIVGDDQSLQIDTPNGLYNTNLKIYCNVRSTR